VHASVCMHVYQRWIVCPALQRRGEQAFVMRIALFFQWSNRE